MDRETLDNANTTALATDNTQSTDNDPFTNSNGEGDCLLKRKETSDLLLDFSPEDNHQRNNTGDSPTADTSCRQSLIFDRPTNGKRSADEFDEDVDMGPETDVDVVDDVPSSPLESMRVDLPDPFSVDLKKKEEVTDLELDLHLCQQQSSEYDRARSPREETPTPPAGEGKILHDFFEPRWNIHYFFLSWNAFKFILVIRLFSGGERNNDPFLFW